MTITQEELKKVLSYDQETGIFKWVDIKGKRKKEAGSVYKFKNGKRYFKIKCTLFCRCSSHRLAWLYITGSFPIGEIDHINGNGLDNRFCNLRDVTRSENKKNTRLTERNTSGVCGVRWEKTRRNWICYIKVNKTKNTTIGRFDNIFDAVCARKNAEIKYGYHKNHGTNRPL